MTSGRISLNEDLELPGELLLHPPHVFHERGVVDVAESRQVGRHVLAALGERDELLA
jgi:hypothetical protein